MTEETHEKLHRSLDELETCRLVDIGDNSHGHDGWRLFDVETSLFIDPTTRYGRKTISAEANTESAIGNGTHFLRCRTSRQTSA